MKGEKVYLETLGQRGGVSDDDGGLGLEVREVFLFAGLERNTTLKDTGSIIFFNQGNGICS